ncbi:MAG: hypothetical protein AAF384_05865 [Pseudomonadota bacterium]
MFRTRLIVLMLFSLIANDYALAALVEWDSANNGRWDDASNWSTNSIPNAGDVVVIDFSGRVDIRMPGEQAGTLTNQATVRARKGGTLDLSDLDNRKTVNINDNGSYVRVTNETNNSGTIAINKAGEFTTDLLTNAKKAKLTANNGSSIRTQGIVDNQGKVTLNKNSSLTANEWSNAKSGQITASRNSGVTVSGYFDNRGKFTLSRDSVATVQTLDNSNRLTVTRDSNLTVQQTLTNSSRTVLSRGAQVNAQSFVQTSGFTSIDQAVLSANTVAIDGGELRGNGVVAGEIVIGSKGRINPGVNSKNAGHLTVDGSLQLLGTTIIDVFNASDFDKINVSGPLTLGGTLRIRFQGGYAPEAGNQFDFLTAAIVGGAFGKIVLPKLPSLNLDIVQTANGVSLLAAAPVPLPPAAWLFLSSAALLVVVGRRGRIQRQLA